MVNLVALRSMQQARYAAHNRGHFALGFDSYLHFTSPIRRYADLVVHRKLKQWMAHAAAPGGARTGSADGEVARMQRIALRISYRERIAVSCEREILDLKKCAFMARYQGCEFAGTISGVTLHGAFVTLDDYPVDGLVRLSDLGSDLHFDERHQVLAARRSGRRYRLGDAIEVRIEEVDQVRARIRLVLAGSGEVAPRSTGRHKPGKQAGRKKFKSRGRSKSRARRRGAPRPGSGRR
jgi:ribonuclease R